ncbi:hypothetical protein MUA01_07255 [Enterobacteriaceae bacterium H18W14]|uniref:hypothetical protein n=1 Tax=Dryocola boscaweniae TaxID=2925397 RepID=UPI0022F094A7|nr:hypothetical protein [Dryocola boscaweniae]MCT4714772.1 hypothetical protein [Dryocola boscaweniae]
MWLIKRVYIDGAGHAEAFYKDLTLDYIGLSQAVDSPAIEGQRSPVRNAKVVTSTYQQLVNGGGKSTYIALLLSIFEPSVSDFTQYLANRRQSEYHYRNYFYKELSVILVEMVNESGQTLLLGHAHQRTGDNVERTLFICDAPDSMLGIPFDEVPSYSRAERHSELRSYANSLHSFESWLNLKAGSEGGMHWRKTSRQSEWRAFLLEQQINVDLIKTMVTFNSEEGGLTRFIEYKTEHDFLGAFFACTMSKDAAERLRELVAHEVERQGELDGIRRNESFLKDVLANWQAFLEPAKQLENTQTQQQLLDDGFREAMRDLSAFIGEAQIEQMQLDDDTRSLQKNIDQVGFLLELLGKRRALLEYDLAQHQLNKQKAMVDALKDEADANQRQIEITRTAIDYKAYAKALEEYRQADEDLKVFQSETERPLQMIFERTAGEALGVLAWAIDRHRQQEANLEKEQGQIDKESNNLRQSCDELQKMLGGLEADREGYKRNKRQGELQRGQLCEAGLIQKGETPGAAQYRLELALRDAQQSEALANTAHHLKEQALEAQQNVATNALVEQSKARQACAQADLKYQDAVDSAQALVKTYRTLPESTQHDIDIEDTNWHSERCGLQIDNVLNVDAQTLNEMKQRLLQAQYELEELKLTGHELVAKQINQALEAFYAAGIARDKLWTFPHYLASVYNDDAQKIAAVIDRNPGRYLSLVALDNLTFEQVNKISEILPWKKAPIAIYLLDEAQDLRNEMPELVQAVLSNPDKYGYSQAAYEARLHELENTVALQESSVEAAESAFKVLQSFRSDWRLHYEQYGKYWARLVEDREQARLTLENVDAALQQAEHYAQILRNEKADALARLNSAQHQKNQTEKAHGKLSHFVETEWAKRETAIMKLEQLAEQIQRSEKTLDSLREAQERQKELADNKLTEKNCISIQISNWNYLCHEPFYSKITALEAIEGRSPKDAHEKATQAHKQLLEATKGDQITALKQQRKDAEQAQRDASERLIAQPAYNAYSDAVKAAALNDLALINSQISHLNKQQKQFMQYLIAAQGTLQYMSKQCEEASKALDEDFVWEEKPIGIETIQTSLAEIANSLHETEYELKLRLEQKTLLLKKIENVKERLQNAKTAQATIQSITPSSAAGLPGRILSITEYADALSTQCQMYASLNVTLKQQNILVATVWGHFRKRIEEEVAKDPDARASQEYLRQLDSIATYHEVLGDLDRVGTGITQVFEAVQDSLEQFQRSIELTVTHLTAHLEGAIKLLKRALSVKIPEDCPVLPGRPIIKMSDRLNDAAADLRSFASSRLQQWIARGQIPRAPNRDALTADLVQSVFGEGELEVRLLKTNASRPQWTLVTRLEGSGGQRLTSAFLLFVTVGKVREYDTGISSAGFLLADNPLGKSNADDLMRIQTQMAKAYKIQLIYLTGISDENAQSMFDNHLFLNKVQKLKRRDLVTVDKERHALWSASLVAKPKFEPVF